MPVFRFWLKQHIGAPSEPVVEKGQSVRRGELIARKPEGALGANLHASITGTVQQVTSDLIEIDPELGWETETSYLPLPSDSPRALLEASGLVGLGGAGFPTQVKLKPMPGCTVILNAAECEPILGHNIAMLTDAPQKALKGLQIAMALTGATRGIVAIKRSHGEAIAAIRAHLPPEVTMCLLPHSYPVGEERAVVREALGLMLGVEALPSAAGAVVLNAETLRRLAEAVEDHKPMMDKDVTVAGKLRSPGVKILRDVPIGLPVSALLERAGGALDAYGELLMGGPYTGKRVTPDSPVEKTTGGLIVTEEFPVRRRRIGLLVCACGPNEARMRELAESMACEVVGVERCKQAATVRGALKCENPGHCPGQAQKVLTLKSDGAEEILIGNCSDCTNTVMACAPKLGLVVHHVTDGALRAVNQKLIRFTDQ